MKPMAVKFSRRFFVSLLASGAIGGVGAEEQTKYVVGIGTPPAEGAITSIAALTLANPYQTNQALSPIYI